MTQPGNLDELRDRLLALGRVSENAILTELSGGVSCLVALVRDEADALVVKVPLDKLAVRDEWTAGLERGANEARILDYLQGQLGPVRTPAVRFFEPTTFILGEEFFEGPPPTYKTELMAGRSHVAIAIALGQSASALHRLTPPDGISQSTTAVLFDELRLDAYYRASALRAPYFADALGDLIDDTLSTPHPTLVHGDLTPKNVLIADDGAVLVDWEVINVGDSSFDLGTMSAHFVLKALRANARNSEGVLEAAHAFWTSYDGPADRQRGLRHCAGVMIARLHGKSPVEYMDDAPSRQRVEAIATDVFNGSVRDINELIQRVVAELPTAR